MKKINLYVDDLVNNYYLRDYMLPIYNNILLNIICNQKFNHINLIGEVDKIVKDHMSKKFNLLNEDYNEENTLCTSSFIRAWNYSGPIIYIGNPLSHLILHFKSNILPISPFTFTYIYDVFYLSLYYIDLFFPIITTILCDLYISREFANDFLIASINLSSGLSLLRTLLCLPRELNNFYNDYHVICGGEFIYQNKSIIIGTIIGFIFTLSGILKMFNRGGLYALLYSIINIFILYNPYRIIILSTINLFFVLILNYFF